jgi:WD40 repeat protein
VTSVAEVPRSRSVVTVGYDGAVALFDLDSPRVALLGYHRHLVNKVAVSDSGAHAASCSSDYTIRIWNLARRRMINELSGHDDDVEDFVFVDDRVGVSASRDHTILIWDLIQGTVVRRIAGHDKDVLSLAYCGRRLYSAGDDKTLRVWDLEGRLLGMWGPFATETDTCAIDAEHGRVVLGCDDGVIRVFEVDSGVLVKAIPAHGSGIKKVSVAPDGQILSAAYDQKIIVWDRNTLEQRLLLEAKPSKWERSFSWSRDGQRIFAGTFDGTVTEWDATTGRLLRELGTAGAEPGNACFNRVAGAPSGAVAAVSDDGYVRIGEVTAGRARWRARAEPASGRMLMNAVALDEARQLVIAGAHDHRIHRYRLADGGLVDGSELVLGEGPINSIAISADPDLGGEAFVGCYSGAICRLASDGTLKAKLRLHDGAVKAVKLHPRAPIGVSCSADGGLLSWKLSGEIVHRLTGHTAIVNDVDLDPTGRRLASVSRDFTLKIYDVASGALVHSIPIGRRSLKSVCFVADDVVVVGDYWGALIRVALPTGDGVPDVRKVAVARNGISSLTRCGALVVAASYDGRLYAVCPETLAVVQHLGAMQQRLDDDKDPG